MLELAVSLSVPERKPRSALETGNDIFRPNNYVFFTHTQTHTHSHTHSHTHTHTHTYVHTYIHTNTHTHTYLQITLGRVHTVQLE